METEDREILAQILYSIAKLLLHKFSTDLDIILSFATEQLFNHLKWEMEITGAASG